MDPSSRRRAWQAFSISVALAVGAGAAGSAEGDTAAPRLANPGFVEWTENGLPSGWEITVGATGKPGNLSRILPLEGGGIALEGDHEVGTWRYVSQSFPVEPGTTYRVRFEARSEGLTRGPDQFRSVYVGLTLRDAAGEPVTRQIADVLASAWREGSVVARAPGNAVRGEVGVFLAMTGRLEVHRVELSVDTRSSFETLVEEMGRRYSRFDLLGIDWSELSASYRERAERAVSPEEFARTVEPLLAELRDVHVWMELPDGKRIYPFHETPESNHDFRSVAGRLRFIEQASRAWLTGRTSQRYGYVAVFSLTFPPETYDGLEKSIDALLGLPGMIVDLRKNRGGDEGTARRIAGIFADGPRPYARALTRSGPGYDEFEDAGERVLEPRRGRTYTDPVVVLIGPNCVSSCEAMAMMFKAQPHATLVGLPTRGASGNPTTVELPIGVTLHYSTWISTLPDGTPIELRGVQPDVAIDADGPGDPTFDAALGILAERIEARPEGRESPEAQAPAISDR